MSDRFSTPSFIRERAVIAMVVLAMALAGSLSGALQRVDHMVFDLGQRLSRAPLADDLVLVMVDEDSLSRLGRWPWSREIHTRLLDTLCAARPAAIGLDIAFSEPQSSGADEALAAAIQKCGNVVLPLVVESARAGGPLVESPPIPLLRAAAAGLGRVGVNIGEDGMVRSVDLFEGVGGAGWPLFAGEVLRVAGWPLPSREAGGNGEVSELYGLVQHGRRRLQFVGPQGSFPRLSYVDVLEGRVPPDLLTNRTVFVGATAVGLGDLFPTPVSAQSQPMAGVEIQANVWSGLRSGTLVRDVEPAFAALLSILLALVPLVWLPRLMPSSALLTSFVGLTVPIVASLGGQVLLQRWFPPMSAVLAGLVVYPLWSWQRLEAARRLLDAELRELKAALPDPQGADNPLHSFGRMGFEQRIASVQAARRRMQELEEQRRDVLAFISHDLRSPLANAIQRLESEPETRPEQLLPTLRRAHMLAQDFLSLARAEALDHQSVKTLDLVSVLHQAADELYAAAHARGMRIERRLPDEAVWIVGDFGAIERSAINLLQNALQHGSVDAPVVLELLPFNGYVRFWVENKGPQRDAAQLEHLFAKFRRGDEHGGSVRSEGGSGLGLYYVRRVAAKHGGQAGVECSGSMIRFWIELPTEATASGHGTR